MLQTKTRLSIYGITSSFKSPRECYKQRSSCCSNSSSSCFKSPRECYKQIERNCSSFYNKCFKSPRECYKHALFTSLAWLGERVSSPQGNATNISLSLILSSQTEVVSSPQGNATNLNVKRLSFEDYVRFKSPRECYKQKIVSEVEVDPGGFKSPRECYKPPPSYSRLLRLTVSSPQGNATNEGEDPEKVKTERSFKSPRECYKPAYYSYPYLILKAVSSPQGNATNKGKKNSSFFFLFQVPKGMLQTRSTS